MKFLPAYLVGLHICSTILLLLAFVKSSMLSSILFMVVWIAFILIAKVWAKRISFEEIKKASGGVYAAVYGTLLLPELFFVMLILGGSSQIKIPVALAYFAGYYFHPFFLPGVFATIRLNTKTTHYKREEEVEQTSSG